MHSYTVYGIETSIIFSKMSISINIACTLIPFTVLKLIVFNGGIKMLNIIACTLIPFTVLKLEGDFYTNNSLAANCMHPYTVYGIETS